MRVESLVREKILRATCEGGSVRIPLSRVFKKLSTLSDACVVEVRVKDDTSQSPEELTRYTGRLSISQIGEKDILHIDLAAPGGPHVFLESPQSEKRRFKTGLSKPFRVPPRTKVSVSLRGPDNVLLGERTVEISTTDPALLKAYYEEKGHRVKYTTMDVFNRLFHQTRLEILRPIFRKYIRPGSTVADIGSGQSIFLAMDRIPSIRLIAVDIDLPMLQEMARRHGEIMWVSAAATQVPIKQGTLDVIYAGEIIEHVADPEKMLDCWSKLLKPEGILILTTPNRNTLSNLLSTYDRPCNPEHISEMTYSELMAALRNSGFELLRVRGIYIEIFLSYWRRLKNDFLAFRMRWKIMWPVFWFLMHLGRLVPRYAFNLTIVARKKHAHPA